MTRIRRPSSPTYFLTACALSVFTITPAFAQEVTGVACSDWAESVALDSRARTLIAGSAADNRILEWPDGYAHFGDLALARLLPDGAIDPTFGDAGSVLPSCSYALRTAFRVAESCSSSSKNQQSLRA